MSPVRPKVVVVGRRAEPEHYRLRDLLTRAAQPYDWFEADSAEGAQVLRRHGASLDSLPVIVDGPTVVERATRADAAQLWQIRTAPARQHYDIAIVGAGPAGLAAAVYAASDGLTTLVVESDVPGGQASYTSLIENFFGFPEGIGGAELARRAGRQAEGFGADLVLLRGVVGHDVEADGVFRFDLAGDVSITSTVAVASPGMEWRRLDAPGVDELLERGVYYGAGRSEAARCSGDDVVVVGAGNSAGQAVLDLTRAGARVTLVVRSDDLGRSMSAYLVRRIEMSPQVDVRLASQVDSVDGSSIGLENVTLHDSSGTRSHLPARAMFICVGGVPRTEWAEAAGVRTDERGFVLTGPDLLDAGGRPANWTLNRDPYPLETSEAGFFAAGDVRSGSTKRVAGAVGEGAMAVALAHRRLAELDRAG